MQKKKTFSQTIYPPPPTLSPRVNVQGSWSINFEIPSTKNDQNASLLIHPKTMSARGCKAGLYWKAKLLARPVHVWSQLQSGMSLMHASIISKRASVIVSKELSESFSRSPAPKFRLRSVPNLLAKIG